MGADEKLYGLLSGDRDIPWGLAAGHFLMVKVASGGLFPDDAQEVCKIILAAAQGEHDEKVHKALEQGALSGMRSIPAGDISAIGKARRTRATRVGEILGMAGGTGAGLLATRGSSPSSKAVGAALGFLGGKTVGKTVGSEVDVARAKARLHGRVKKAAAEEKKSRFSPGARSALVGAGLGALGGSGYGALAVPYLAKRQVGQVSAAYGPDTWPKHTPELQGKLTEQMAHFPEGMKEVAALVSQGKTDAAAKLLARSKSGGLGPVGRTLSSALVGAGVGALTGAAAHALRESHKEHREGTRKVKLTGAQQAILAQKYGPEIMGELGLRKAASISRIARILTKVADQQPGGDSAITSPVVPMPSESPLIGQQPQQPLHPEIEAQLNQMQQTNEAEFYRQQAEEAQQQAADGKQRVDELIQQLNMLNQQSQSQMQQDQQVRQMAEQQAQMASQDSMQARNESLQSQQQNMQLRTAVTQFRQALMNLVAQDPTMMLGPPPVQTGPMPPPPGGAPPEMAGAAPGASPEAGPPGGGAPGAPPEAAAPGGPPPGPPALPAAPQLPAPEPMAPPPPVGGAAPAPMAG